MILVTGATGLVGSNLLYSLLLSGRQVRALLHNVDNIKLTRRIFKSYGSDAEAMLERVEWVQGDVLDTMALYEAMKGVDRVYHCAAIVSFDTSDREQMMKVNVEGTANVVNAALEAKVNKLCYVSSIAALGRTDDSDVIDENSEWTDSKLNSWYSKSKHKAEREVWRASAEGLPVVIVNPAIIFGYGNPEKGSSRMFSTIHRISRFYGKGINGFVDVQDVVKAMIKLMDSEIRDERFVVSAGNFTYKQIFSWIAEGFGKPVPIIAIPDFVLGVVWRFEALRSLLTGDKPLISRETSNTSKNNFYYSTDKLISRMGFQYKPMEQTIKLICRLMEDEVKGKG